ARYIPKMPEVTLPANEIEHTVGLGSKGSLDPRCRSGGGKLRAVLIGWVLFSVPVSLLLCAMFGLNAGRAGAARRTIQPLRSEDATSSAARVEHDDEPRLIA